MSLCCVQGLLSGTQVGQAAVAAASAQQQLAGLAPYLQLQQQYGAQLAQLQQAALLQSWGGVAGGAHHHHRHAAAAAQSSFDVFNQLLLLQGQHAAAAAAAGPAAAAFPSTAAGVQLLPWCWRGCSRRVEGLPVLLQYR